MAKLNIWFARGFSDRVKSVDPPKDAVSVDWVDGHWITKKTYFKNDQARFQAYLKGYNSATVLFRDSPDPEHQDILEHDRLNWEDAHERPTLYPRFLMAAWAYPYYAIISCPGDAIAPVE